MAYKTFSALAPTYVSSLILHHIPLIFSAPDLSTFFQSPVFSMLCPIAGALHMLFSLSGISSFPSLPT